MSGTKSVTKCATKSPRRAPRLPFSGPGNLRGRAFYLDETHENLRGNLRVKLRGGWGRGFQEELEIELNWGLIVTLFVVPAGKGEAQGGPGRLWPREAKVSELASRTNLKPN